MRFASWQRLSFQRPPTIRAAWDVQHRVEPRCTVAERSVDEILRPQLARVREASVPRTAIDREHVRVPIGDAEGVVALDQWIEELVDVAPLRARGRAVVLRGVQRRDHLAVL